jgi:hypothetical protein
MMSSSNTGSHISLPVDSMAGMSMFTCEVQIYRYTCLYLYMYMLVNQNGFVEQSVSNHERVAEFEALGF